MCSPSQSVIRFEASPVPLHSTAFGCMRLPLNQRAQGLSVHGALDAARKPVADRSRFSIAVNPGLQYPSAEQQPTMLALGRLRKHQSIDLRGPVKGPAFYGSHKAGPYVPTGARLSVKSSLRVRNDRGEPIGVPIAPLF